MGKDAHKATYPPMETGVFVKADSWEEAERILAAQTNSTEWFVLDEFCRGIVEREAIPHYMDSFQRAYDSGAKGQLHGFFLHPASNLLRYPKNDPTLAAWSGELYNLGFEVKPAPSRDNSDGALGAIIIAFARVNSWEEAETACLGWAQANHWEIVSFVDDMRDAQSFTALTAVSDAGIEMMGGTSHALKYYQAEWEGIAVIEQIWDEE